MRSRGKVSRKLSQHFSQTRKKNIFLRKSHKNQFRHFEWKETYRGCKEEIVHIKLVNKSKIHDFLFNRFFSPSPLRLSRGFFSFLHYHHRHRRIKSSLITRLITEIDSCNEGCKHYLEAIRKDALKVLSYAKEP